ncbi:hypothetical protein HDU87_000233 [Geranomyces variabilis]|uniref:Uncharacterized protein n=1 Tax=Geranomyces variabilis TaxID=109894 RepID=A0AAD5XW67_9FUNG|nr:hypothetical protein HDU87_000233 [Geranomyces variabilis]
MAGLSKSPVSAEISDIVCRLCRYASELATPKSLQASPTALDRLHRDAVSSHASAFPAAGVPTASGSVLRNLLLSDVEKLTHMLRNPTSLPSTTATPATMSGLLRSVEATALTAGILLPNTRERILVSVAEVLAVMRAVVDGAGEKTLVCGVHAFLDSVAVMDEVGPEVDVWGLKEGVERVMRNDLLRKDEQSLQSTPYTALLQHLHDLETTQLRLLEVTSTPPSQHPLPLSSLASFPPQYRSNPSIPSQAKVALVLTKKECEPALSVRRKLLFGSIGSGVNMGWKLAVARLAAGSVAIYPAPQDVGAQDLGSDVRDPENLCSPQHTHTLRNATLQRTSSTGLTVHLQNGLALILDFGCAARATEWEGALLEETTTATAAATAAALAAAAAGAPSASRRASISASRPAYAAVNASGGNGGMGQLNRASVVGRRTMSGGGGFRNSSGSVGGGGEYLSYPSASSFVA